MLKMMNENDAREEAERRDGSYGHSVFPDAYGTTVWYVGDPEDLVAAGVVPEELRTPNGVPLEEMKAHDTLYEARGSHDYEIFIVEVDAKNHRVAAHFNSIGNPSEWYGPEHYSRWRRSRNRIGA